MAKHLKKSLGQHLLTRPEVAEKIATFLSFEGYEHVVEVGPGQGILTQHLVKQKNKLVAVEFDQDMITVLEKTFTRDQLDLIQGDFLRINMHPFFDGQQFALIGNYPYNISSQIVFKMLEYRTRIPEMVGMFQKEMAARIIAPHGSKTYGGISVLTQAYYSGEAMMTLKPGSFSPPPKVNSMVIRLRRKEDYPEVEYKFLRRVVKSAFGKRRKKLSNALKGVVPVELLKELYFADLRAEQLSVENFINIAQHLGN
jgi:16S rRNA (adenine1518-N6/adenine1519-N6)-dimethyltransferase